MLDLFTKTVPTMAGLATIPFIVHPIDNGIHMLLNFTLRPALSNYICNDCKGTVACLDCCETCVVPAEDGSNGNGSNGTPTS